MTVATKTYNKHQLYGILKNYFWMINEIKRLDAELKKTDFKGVSQYGMSASLPTGKGIVSKALENEIVRRNEKRERLNDYIYKVNYLNDHRSKITDEREKVVLDCILDGMSLAAIARHLGTYRKQINMIQDDIVSKISES
jgi:DNA-binding NarL/FixJ family response regulator